VAAAVTARRPLVGVTCDLLRVRDAFKFTTYDRYVNALRAAGARVVMLPPVAEEAASHVELVSGVVLVGGDDIDPALWGGAVDPALVIPSAPQRTAYELALVRRAAEQDLPVLGVCLGLQTLNVARGGSLRTGLAQAPVRHPKRAPGDLSCHHVDVEAGSLLARALELQPGGRVDVNSSHRWAVDRVGEGLHASAVAEDGVIEALEDPAQRFCLGVQWHPEVGADGDDVSRRLFAAFVRACAGRAAGP
jgi:gamma-glutamyl-gamma-aminobutyrate hydrolase PuuD